MNPNQIYTLVYIFTTFPPEVSGSARFNWERVQWLAKQEKYRVVVLTNHWEEADVPTVPPGLEKNLIIETFPSKPWIVYNLLRVPTFSAARLIRQRLAYYQPDIITVVDLEGLFFFSTWHLVGRNYARKHGIPYITEYRTDYYSIIQSSTYPAWNLVKELFVKPISIYLYHQCDATLAISPAASRSLKQLGISNAHQVLVRGVDLSALNPSRRNRKCLEPWLTAQEQNNKVIFFLGRVAFEKRIDLLIQAFARLKPRQEKFSLIIAGDGPVDIVNKLKRLAQPIPNIHFIGFIFGETKANLLASCDVFCSPSPYETFGGAMVEAMASGIPVVSVNSGGVSDYMIDGVNGYLVPPNDVDGLTNALEKALSDDNTEIIQKALQDAQQLSSEQGCQNLDNYYQQLLNSKPTSYSPVMH
ncbi:MULTISPECIES: glycosyltransferase [unclassified Nostoc]|uniref:glycosyltransferase n=1 Tax=unclassified Nostoc TaxID=2593658 RepID=UPI002AD4740F|nr:glycosyltransferase [Nostoc sp. DedQUE03]MDZ7975569.1 glycosyltransferase [Nostoc sp. DedQUE03]MDZ8048786.1 glycosyltransferase [Nostoc sp. DedQUE02]